MNAHNQIQNNENRHNISENRKRVKLDDSRRHVKIGQSEFNQLLCRFFTKSNDTVRYHFVIFHNNCKQ